MSLSLSQRLRALSEAHRATLILIQELRTFPNSQRGNGDPDQQRLELASEIHDNLREQEDTLDLLAQELEDDPLPRHSSSRGRSKEEEHGRNVDVVARLREDLKIARANFRRAQLQAKRQADAEKKKEREQLFADRKLDGQPRVRPTHEKLTQDELALRAADDVTSALRRVHNQLEGELARSQFAQQTLVESQQALDNLSQSYSGTTDLLKTSRGFVTQLIRSNKSDTWFLKSSFYVLAATLCWLFYRRILYGPMMLLIWWPFRMLWWALSSFAAASFGRANLAPSAAPKPTLSVSMPGVNSKGMPTHTTMQFKSVDLPAKGGGWGSGDPVSSWTSPESTGTVSGISADVGQEYAPNTKKRMMEVEFESRDEL